MTTPRAHTIEHHKPAYARLPEAARELIDTFEEAVVEQDSRPFSEYDHARNQLAQGFIDAAGRPEASTSIAKAFHAIQDIAVLADQCLIEHTAFGQVLELCKVAHATLRKASHAINTGGAPCSDSASS